jgi:hypothetical protein
MRSRSRSSFTARSRSCLAIVALAVISSACGSDSSTGPSDTGVRADLAQAFRELGHPAVGDAIQGMTGLFFTPGPSSGCPYTAASQTFVCPSIDESGLSLAFSYALLDGSGAAQSAFGATTTNSVHTISVISGTATDLGDSFSISGRQDMTVSGLLSTKHTLNGTSDFHVTGSFDTGSGTLPFAFRTKTTITNLVLPTGTNAYPASGTILAEESQDAVPGTDRVLMTFNGTSSIALVFTFANGSVSHCTMNLAQGGDVSCTD